MEGFTLEDVERRNYTFVSVNVINDEGWTKLEEFIVSSPYKLEARALALQYINNRGWQLRIISPHSIMLHPRKYIKDARKLFEEGKYL